MFNILCSSDCSVCKDAKRCLESTLKYPLIFSCSSPPTHKHQWSHAESESFLHRFLSVQKKILSKFVKKTWSTGYQMFYSSHADVSVPFHSKSSEVSKLWSQLSLEDRAKYVSMAKDIKEQSQDYIKKNYASLKDKINSINQSYQSQKKPRMLNSFMLYLKDVWEESQQLSGFSVGYHEVRLKATEEWNKNDSLRCRYAEIYEFKKKGVTNLNSFENQLSNSSLRKFLN